MKTLSFRRAEGSRIETTGGTSYSGRITCLGRAGAHEVWSIAPGHVYSGLGRPWNRTPSRLFLVKVDGDVAAVIKECKPGAQWVAKRREFLDEMAELNGDKASLSTFAREG